jgi:hypothetical protein
MRTPPPSPLETGVPSGKVTAVWRPFQPITRAPGAVPWWKPRANNADSSFPVLNRPLKAGRSVATFDIKEARPEQSVPAAEFPPVTYGVPDICSIRLISVAKTNMTGRLQTRSITGQNLCAPSPLRPTHDVDYMRSQKDLLDKGFQSANSTRVEE